MKTTINDYGVERFTQEQHDIFYQKFKDITMSHVDSISDVLFERYQKKAAGNDIVSPDFESNRDFIFDLSRKKFVSKIISECDDDEEFFNSVISNTRQEIVGEIEGGKVYFLPKKGIYIWHISHANADLIFQVWLTWPCYPIDC